MANDGLHKLIIDTSGSYEDVVALLFALSGDSDSLEVPLVTLSNPSGQLTEGVKNVVSMFEHLKEELEWRQRERRQIGYQSLYRTKPVVAIGASHPLNDGQSAASDVGSQDRATEIWRVVDTQRVGPSSAENKLFHRSVVPGHVEMLRVLRENHPGTVTIIALAPLTTLALAAATDPETFLRAEEVVFLGGTMHASDIALIAAESNTYQDPLAAARLFAMTTPVPGSAMLQGVEYSGYLPTRVLLLLFPLESTNAFFVTQESLSGRASDSPLRQWLTSVLKPTFANSTTPGKGRLRAPVTIWYAKTPFDWEWVRSNPLDVRVELAGELKGLCIIDTNNIKDESKGLYEEGRWVDENRGTRMQVVTNDCANVYEVILFGDVFGAPPLVRDDD